MANDAIPLRWNNFYPRGEKKNQILLLRFKKSILTEDGTICVKLYQGCIRIPKKIRNTGRSIDDVICPFFVLNQDKLEESQLKRCCRSSSGCDYNACKRGACGLEQLKKSTRIL